jgi:hypothetical protein
VRDWLTEEQGGMTWTDGDESDNRLIPNVEYTYIVIMRDSIGNESASSGAMLAIAELVVDDLDTEAPPVPVWLSEVIRFECKPANIFLEECDEEGWWDVLEVEPSEDPQAFEVEYYFEEANTHENSGWIKDAFWISAPDGPYSNRDYRVKVRDTSQRKNESDWSIVISRT